MVTVRSAEASSRGDPDVFGTAALREAVLNGWAASVDRFREDANAEQDLALGGYRDRLVVELAQNAADAAARAGVPGRLLLQLDTGHEGAVLVAANTGARLDAVGVRALATLRASAKRDDPRSTGRFGVGFSAVLTVSDEPAVLGHGSGVRFSRAETLAAVRESAVATPQLAAELARRADHVPALRLPWPAEGNAPKGYDTAVVLPLRDAAATDLVRRLLDEVGDALLLALPGLEEVVVQLPGEAPRQVRDVGERWVTVRRSGFHGEAALADRPVEERERRHWALTWALPVDPGTAVPAVLHAPTPTSEPMSWPALLLADLPLDPDRQHVVDGPATRAVADQAGEAFADLVTDVADDDPLRALDLVPVGLPSGWFDALVREAALAALPAAPVLRAVEDGSPVRPRDAVLLDGPAGADPSALAVLAPALAGLVSSPPAAGPALRRLGVRRLELVEVVEAWPAGDGEDVPLAWSRRYAGLAGVAADPAVREALTALPVPLADGRVVRGVPGVVMPLVDGHGSTAAEVQRDRPSLADALAVLADHGLRVVHPEAVASQEAAGLLERLGAVPATATQVLEHPAVRAAVRWTTDDPDPLEVSEAVLALVAAAWAERAWPPGEHGWLSDLALPDDEGDPTPAGLLVQPGSTAQALFDPEAVGLLDADVAARWPSEVLHAAGVAAGPVLVRSHDVDLGDLPAELDELDGAREWADQVAETVGPQRDLVAEVVAVRDLDLVLGDAWPALLQAIGSDPVLRRALVEPLVVAGDSRPRGSAAQQVPSYTAWWLRERVGLGSALLPGVKDPLLRAVLRQAPRWADGLDTSLVAALGLVEDWSQLGPSAWERVLDELPVLDRDRVDAGGLLRAWAALARSVSPPDSVAGQRLWAMDEHLQPVLVQSGGAVVPDDPRWLQRHDLGPMVVAPPGRAEALADVFDLDLAGDLAAGEVTTSGREVGVPEEVLVALPDLPTTWLEHDELQVDGVSVDWWVEAGTSGSGSARVHAANRKGLARALAYAIGHWSRRSLLTDLLEGGAPARRALADAALDE